MNEFNSVLIESVKAGFEPRYIFFWGHTPVGAIGVQCFSQWWEGNGFTDGEHTYYTAEHYMMAQKALLFDDKEMFEKIAANTNPRDVKALGRKIKNFNSEVWDEEKLQIVERGNFFKFSQHPALRDFLIAIIVEASPFDPIWGIGMDANHPDRFYPEKWKGQNLLGIALMSVRELLIISTADVS